jgi:predicted GTPase
MERTIAATPCDLVLVATPIDLTRLIAISMPVLRVTYRVEDRGEPTLAQVVEGFLNSQGPRIPAIRGGPLA